MRTPTTREKPSATLVRYATAIDAHYARSRMSAQCERDRRKIHAKLQSIERALRQGKGGWILGIRVGLAIGACQTYVERYNVSVPAYTPA